MPWVKRPMVYEDDFLTSGPTSPKQNWIDYATLYRDYFVFAIIRNPWERFVSGWKYCKSTKDKSLIDVLSNLPTKEFDEHDYHHLTRTQYSFLYHRDKLIPHYLIRMERFQEGFDEVCKRIGKPRVELKKLNTTEHTHYRDYFNSDESRRLFERHFKDDIDTFGYNFGSED